MYWGQFQEIILCEKWEVLGCFSHNLYVTYAD